MYEDPERSPDLRRYRFGNLCRQFEAAAESQADHLARKHEADVAKMLELINQMQPAPANASSSSSEA